MIGKNTVAKLSSFLRIRPMFLGLFGLAWFEPETGLAVVEPAILDWRRGLRGVAILSFLEKSKKIVALCHVVELRLFDIGQSSVLMSPVSCCSSFK